MTNPDRSFRLDPAAWEAEAGRAGRRTAALALVTALLVVAVWALALRSRGGGPASLVLPLALLAALAAFSHRSRMRRSRARWEGFLVAFDGDAVRREIPGFPEVTIARGEVTAVEEGPGGIAVRAGERALFVPRQLLGYARFRDALAAWRGGA